MDDQENQDSPDVEKMTKSEMSKWLRDCGAKSTGNMNALTNRVNQVIKCGPP